jgi:hypothetical protein
MRHSHACPPLPHGTDGSGHRVTDPSVGCLSHVRERVVRQPQGVGISLGGTSLISRMKGLTLIGYSDHPDSGQPTTGVGGHPLAQPMSAADLATWGQMLHPCRGVEPTLRHQSCALPKCSRKASTSFASRCRSAAACIATASLCYSVCSLASCNEEEGASFF